MQILASLLVVAVATLHAYFLVLETFLWTSPFGRRTFGMTAELAQATKTLASNQGLYNGFLAAGLIWALIAYGVAAGRPVLTFFLACIVIAGIYGGLTVNRRIVLVQAVPAFIAGVLVWIS